MLTPVRSSRTCFLRKTVIPWQFPKLLISCRAGRTPWLGCRVLWEGLGGLQQELRAQQMGWHRCHLRQQKWVTSSSSSVPSGGSLQQGRAFLSSVRDLQTCLASLQASPSLRAGGFAPKRAVLAACVLPAPR